ncbi:unnamed protein product [Urochloa humidicola]
MRIRTRTQQAGPVVVCLQAQHVAGLPAAAEGRQVLLRLTAPGAAAAAVCRGGVAAFHGQVLLLDLLDCSGSILSVAVTVGDTASASAAAVVHLHLHLAEQEQLRRPSPDVLTLVLGGAADTTAGAVLSLALHHSHMLVIPRRRRRCSCMMSCLLPTVDDSSLSAAHHRHDGASSSSSGFITIEKQGTIHISAGRHPPSDNLLTDDDDDHDKVEDEFLAMLDADDLACWTIKDADLAARPPIKYKLNTPCN